MFAQTLLLNSPYIEQKSDESFCNLRHIDFSRGDRSKGNPYVFIKDDYDELIASPMLFARKFDINVDSKIVEMLFQHLRETDIQAL